MDEVLSLKPSAAIRRLQTAVRESQGTTRASYAAKNRPEWWKEKVNVTLPDGTIVKTGAFVSHSKCAWKPEQVQAALILFFRDLNGKNTSESNSSPHLTRSTPPRTKPKAERIKPESRPVRTRYKTEQTRLQSEIAPNGTSQKFESEPLTRSRRLPERKRGVTFQDEHEANIHHTPPRNFRRRKRGPIKITPESSAKRSPSAHPSSSRLDAKEELSEAKLESEIERQQSSPSPSPVRRAAPRRVVKKTSVKELPGLISSRAKSTRSTLPRSVKEAPTSNKVHKDSRLILKKKGKKRVHRTAESAAKPSPELLVTAIDSSPSVASAAEKENTSPGGTKSNNRRRSSRLSATGSLTPEQMFGVKRNLDETLSESRTPLATVKNHENTNAVKVVKRRKTTGKKVAVRSTRKSSRKANGGTEVIVDNISSQEEENFRTGHEKGKGDNESSDQAVLSVRHSPRLQSARRVSHSEDLVDPANLEDVSVGEPNEDDIGPHESNDINEEGEESGTNMEEEQEMDEEEARNH
ncbi:hypothetical protein FGB62_37g21 [Gracilaria domingensis]|nr:hypothetical protein FGB62_37g21 [Gracilaria domingensis]